MEPNDPFKDVLNSDTKVPKITAQVVEPNEGISVKLDQLLHDPKHTSEHHSMDDEDEQLPKPSTKVKKS